MKSNVILAGAVAAALGVAGPACALNKADTAAATFIYAGGSSAAQAAIEGAVKGYCVTNTIDTYWSGTGGSVSPDLHVISCTLNNAISLNGTKYSNNIAFAYHAEGGSATGAGAVAKGIAPAYLNVNSGICAADGLGSTGGGGLTSSVSCTIPGWCEWTDTSTSGTALSTALLAFGFADVECGALIGDNWPWGFTWLNPSGNVGPPATCPANNQAFAQVFEPIVASTNTATNITHTELSQIISGEVTDWSYVPGGPSSGQITVCRRDPGSGTQSTLELEFAKSTGAATGFTAAPDGSYCGNKTRSTGLWIQGGGGAPGVPVSTATVGGTLLTVVNETTGQVLACVSGNASAIGFVGVQHVPGGADKAGTKHLTVDGIDPNVNTAAIGQYNWAYESSYYTNLPGSGVVKDLITQFAADIQDYKVFVTRNGGTSTSVLSIPGKGSSGNPIGTSTAPLNNTLVVGTAQPIWQFSRGGNSCSLPIDQL